MSAPICAGPTCRCRAHSSRCCAGSSISPATPRRPAPASPARPARRRWRRCTRSTVSARSVRRRRLPSRCRPITTTAPRPDHPPGFYGPAEGPVAVNTLAAADRIAPLDTSALACAARDLHQCRAARSARHAAVGRAGAVPDRCDHRRHARRRPCRADPPPRRAGRDPARRVRRRRADRAMAVARRKQRRVRDARGVADARSPMSSPATPTSIPSSRPAWPA